MQETKIDSSIATSELLLETCPYMDELGFYVPSTVFQSFQDDGRVNMKGSVQWSAVKIREESRLQRDSNPWPLSSPTFWYKLNQNRMKNKKVTSV